MDSAHDGRGDRAARWWSSLDGAVRQELEAMDDPARDDIARTRAEDGASWVELPIELRGHFVDPEDAREDAMWREDLIEYLNAHPEIDFFLRERRFRICRAHPDARRVLETGRIPHDFVCPLARSACPLAEALALAPGATIVLRRVRASGAP